nr:CRISPR-associated endonuclease Cas1 [Marivivens aquimaris]
MVGRISELSRDGLAVHKSRGFLSVREGGVEIGKAELDDLDAVLVTAQGLMWSNIALAHLAAHNVPVMILNANFAPNAVVMPLCGNGEHGYRMRNQAAASLPLRKQIWARLVRQKIAAQAALLKDVGCGSERVKRLSHAVRSGEPDNREGRAAQLYWTRLLGRTFRRDRDEAAETGSAHVILASLLLIFAAGVGGNTFCNNGPQKARSSRGSGVANPGLSVTP